MPANVPSLGQAVQAVRPIVEAASKRVSPAAAMRTAEYVVSYAWMAEHLGREPKIAEHAEALSVSRRTYLYRRAMFHEAFPDAASPLDVEGAREIATTPVTAPLGTLRLT